MTDAWLAGENFDPVTIADGLRARGCSSVSESDLSQLLAEDTGSPSLVDRYAGIIRSASVKRQLLIVCADVAEAAKKDDVEGDEALSLAFQRLAGVVVSQTDDSTAIHDLVKERMGQLGQMADARAKGHAAIAGVPTGIASLDAVLGGFQRGIVTIGAGRPGMGKSAFALSCVRNATSQGIGCHVFSLEDTREAYVDRVIAGESGIPTEALRTGELRHDQLGRIRASVDSLAASVPWLVDDRGGIDAEEIVRSVRRNMAKNKTQLVVVDYIQLIRGNRRLERHEAIGQIMQTFADAAKQDKVCYLVLSQLNRECEKRKPPKPVLSDLKESGSIEERAKCVLLFYREKYYNSNAKEDDVEIIVAKFNQGRTGSVKAHWNGSTVRMS
jgi:replicative DNA helicase